MGYLLSIIRMILMIIWIIIIVGIGAPLYIFKITTVNFGFKLRTIFCKVAIFILGIKIFKTGQLYKHEQTLYVGNHRSLVDPVAIFAYITSGYAVSKAEVESYPLIGAGAKMSGVIFVRRDDKGSRKNARESIVNALLKKYSIVLFPEGTISRERKTLTFKKGAFESAVETQSTIVPFAMEYHSPSKDFWLNDNILIQFIRTFSKLRTGISIHFFDPMNSNDAMQLTLDCEKLINDKINAWQKQYWSEEELIKFDV